jgi:alginate O-acetyltransferase complex protein AlgI
VLFQSPTFLLLLLPAVLVGYHLVPRLLLLPAGPRRLFLNLFLFAASLFFYAWGEQFNLLVLFGSLVANYGLARLAERRPRAVAAVAVIANLGLLVWIKYAGFLAANASALWVLLGGQPFHTPPEPGKEPHLLLGISFFTFQAMSYVIDVARGEVPAERSFLRFGVYVFLFPHLIAGPIVRYRDIADQLKERPVGGERFATGVRRLAVGLGKKLLLADVFAEAANQAFGTPTADLSAGAAWLGVACFTLQIYFDFSGYSDMAIGLGKMVGFDFLENFRHPYTAASVTDFWRRWHVSLSSWFRDYLYIPLGGNRGGRWRTYRNLLIVFALCGLWHGANWTFLAWGLIHGGFLVAERVGFGAVLERLPAPVRHAYTLVAVMVGWVFFRATSVDQAVGVLAAMAGLTNGTTVAADVWKPTLAVALPAGVLACLPVVPWLLAARERWVRQLSDGRAAAVEAALAPLGAAAVGLLFVAAGVQVVAGTHNPFIYFRF